jgi:hypothetical protein
MPRWACRLVLETVVRFERLQAMSDADALAEGFEPCTLVTSCARQTPIA